MQEKLENTIRFVDFMRWQIFRNLKLNDLFSGTFPNQITQPSIRHICAVLNLLNMPTWHSCNFFLEKKSIKTESIWFSSVFPAHHFTTVQRKFCPSPNTYFNQ